MKRIVLLIVLLIPLFIFCQETVSGVSKSGYVNITKDPPKPPYLEISGLRFLDTDDNMKIDATEQAFIYFDLLNSGLGPGLNLKLSVNENNNISNLEYRKSKGIGTIEVGKTQQIQIPINSSMDLTNGRALFVLKIEEANGFDSDPVEIEIETRAFRSPEIKIVDYKLTSQSSSTLQKRKPFDIQVLIQNVGEGTADAVTVKLPIPKGVFCLSQNETIMIGVMESGGEHLVDYTLVTNNEYNSSTIPLNFELSEKHGRYAQNRNITLSMNQGVSSEKLVIKGETETTTTIAVASLSSKVDKNIPTNPVKNPNRLALVIGNEDYSRTLNSEVNVDYARNDAEVFRQYAIQTMGVEDRNMHFLLDATVGQMQREIDLVTAILQRLGDKGELIFYYAGHGFPDENTKIPYLIPVDVDATNLHSAIKLSDVYRKFGNTDASKITIFLDACFSGGGRNQGLLAARSVKVRPKEDVLTGNLVVFSASSGEQSALPYESKKHGMFTYYLLDKIQQTKGTVTYEDLSLYLTQKVGIESLRENGKPQDPEVNKSHTLGDKWKVWTVK